MSEVAWASEALQQRIAPIGSEQLVKSRIRRAARALGWTFSRTKSVWYADERTSIKPRELRQIEHVAGIEYGRKEIRDINALIRSADALTMGTDPDFASAFAAALRAFFGALDSTRTPRG